MADSKSIIFQYSGIQITLCGRFNLSRLYLFYSFAKETTPNVSGKKPCNFPFYSSLEDSGANGQKA